MQPSLVSVVIVSYNTRDVLRRALLSVFRDPATGGADDGDQPGRPYVEAGQLDCSSINIECLVIDNASHDGSADMVAREFPQVVLFRSDENRGFAAAVNQGLERARGEYVLLLNPDAELLDDGLRQMVAFLAARPRVAAVGPRLIYGDGTPQHAAFAFPTLPMIFLDFFPLHGRLLDSRLNGRYPLAAAPHPIDHPLGACILLRREALEDVGFLDDSFFMYCEEADWCLRAWQRGWKVYHLPDVVARHLGAQSTSQRRDAMFVELHRSRLRLYRKHYSPLFCLLAKAITRLGLWAEAQRARRAAAEGSLSATALAERLMALHQIRAVLRTT